MPDLKIMLIRRLVPFFGAGLLFVFTLFFLIPLPDPLFENDYSLVIRDKDQKILRVYLNNKEQWILPPGMTTIPPKLQAAVLEYEDREFFYHSGVDISSIFRAIAQNIQKGYTFSGASTISMQVARMTEQKERTYINKFLEILQALKIDQMYTKQEILELYLNHAPYGGNIQGFVTASYRYFGKAPKQLSWAEACTLAVLPNNPAGMYPGKNNDLLLEKRNDLLSRLLERGFINRHQFEDSLEEPLPTGEVIFPYHASHAARFLKSKGYSGLVDTTLDYVLQENIEFIAGYHSAYLQTMGIPNMSILIADTKSGAIRAYLGSQDFSDDDTRGQVDGVLAPRSTGSILKPFLYALEIDKGKLIPDSYVIDIPTYFGAYSPKNFTRFYDGVTSMRSALTRSLNVPAVRQLASYGLIEFYRFLQKAGVSSLFRQPEEYGLPLILGGAEISPLEIGALYRGIGTLGEFGPLYLHEDMKKTDTRLLSRGAAYLIADVLTEVNRPGEEALWEFYSGRLPLAWKTGTSYGQRDGWAVGVSPEYTIVVWIGNFDGSENPNLVTAKMAGPVLFDVFNFLVRSTGGSWFAEPVEDLRDVEVCSTSGFRATESCPHKRTDYMPLHAAPLPVCSYHETMYVTPDEAFRLTSSERSAEAYKEVKILRFPPAVAQFMREKGQAIEVLPPYRNPISTAEHTVSMVYPVQGATIFLPRDVDGTRQRLIAKGASSLKNDVIYWYIDQNFLGSTKNEHNMDLELTEGRHKLTIVSSTGSKDSIDFTIFLRKDE